MNDSLIISCALIHLYPSTLLYDMVVRGNITVRQHYTGPETYAFTVLIIDPYDHNARRNLFKYLSGSLGRYVASGNAYPEKDQCERNSREDSFRGQTPTVLRRILTAYRS